MQEGEMHLKSLALGGGAGNQTPLACTPWAWLAQKQRTKHTLTGFELELELERVWHGSKAELHARVDGASQTPQL
jgi:hypothetical protein